MSEPALQLSIVLPTFCEAANVARAVAALEAALPGIAWEAIFVDDASPDGTADAVRAIARADRRVRIVERIGRRGLSSASIEGMLAASAPLVAVMDADLQHDASLLPHMIAALADPAIDIAIGTRFAAGGSTGDWERERVDQSRLAGRISRLVLRADLSDPMSGFFMIRADIFRRMVPRLSGIGFKIMLDLFTAAQSPLRFVELPYRFHRREVGESKLDYVVAMEFGVALYDRMFGRIVPARFAMFGAIGAIGIVIHMSLLGLGYGPGGLHFVAAQALATLGAMTANFFLNNALTYRDRRLHGGRALLRGWASFCLVCAVGALANVGVAAFLFEIESLYWMVSALAGILVSAVWNFALSSRFVWGRY